MNNSEEHNHLSPELKDLIETIKRYNISHPKGQFVISLVGFEKDMEHICEDCGDHCDQISDKNTFTAIHGDLYMLREIVNSLRDMIEDNIDEDGFVNI